MIRILFILPGEGGGGGAHSVVQETLGLNRLGAHAMIAVQAEMLEAYRKIYPELEGSDLLQPFDTEVEIAAMLENRDIACATSWNSVELLRAALSRLSGQGQRAAYYVQDYEPLFCAPGSRAWEEARASYTRIPGMLLFAKTRFLRELVEINHGVTVRKVSPSLDHGLYRPLDAAPHGPLNIAAMLRTRTPRRAAHRTARILNAIAARHSGKVRCVSFGCDKEALAHHGIALSNAVTHLGVLDRCGVAKLLGESALFLDLSDYQAFGRTGLEAMACGVVPVLPVFGGAGEYLRHWVNGFVVDTRSDTSIMETIAAFLALPPETRIRMRQAAIATAAGYSIERAAQSELALFQECLTTVL